MEVALEDTEEDTDCVAFNDIECSGETDDENVAIDPDTSGDTVATPVNENAGVAVINEVEL